MPKLCGEEGRDRGIKELKKFQRIATKCPNCKEEAYAYTDTIMGEKICLACGFVQGPETINASGVVVVPKPFKSDNSNKGKSSIDKEEHVFLSNAKKKKRMANLIKRYDKTASNDKTAYNYEKYKEYAQIVKSNYQMNNDHLQYVYDVLDYIRSHGGLQKLHPNASSEKIILSICIFAMWRSYRIINVQFDPYVAEVKLTKNIHERITLKLMELDKHIMEYAQKESLNNE